MYSLKGRKKTKSENLKNKGKIKLLSWCTVYNGKNLRFIKKQEASRLLSSLGIKAPSSKTSPLVDILF